MSDRPEPWGDPIAEAKAAIADAEAHYRSKGRHGSRTVTPEDRADAVKRDIASSTSAVRITPGMRRHLHRRSWPVRVLDALARLARRSTG